MNEKKTSFVWNRDRIASIAVVLLSIAMIVETGNIKATYGNIGGNDPGSKLFPYAIAIIMILCAIGKFITCNKPDEAPFLNGKRGQLRICAVIGVLIAYAWLLPKIGFLVCTFVFSVIQVYVMRDQVKVKMIHVILFGAVLTGALYIVFQTVLGIRLPAGVLWKTLR